MAKFPSKNASSLLAPSERMKALESRFVIRKQWLTASTSLPLPQQWSGTDLRINLSCGCKAIAEHIALGKAFPSLSCNSARRSLSERFLEESKKQNPSKE